MRKHFKHVIRPKDTELAPANQHTYFVKNKHVTKIDSVKAGLRIPKPIIAECWYIIITIIAKHLKFQDFVLYVLSQYLNRADI